MQEYPEQDFGLKMYMKFQEAHDNKNIYKEVYAQVPAEGLKALFVKLQIIKNFVRSEGFDFELEKEWISFWQKNLNSANKTL
jgi:hypothetical protein